MNLQTVPCSRRLRRTTFEKLVPRLGLTAGPCGRWEFDPLRVDEVLELCFDRAGEAIIKPTGDRRMEGMLQGRPYAARNHACACQFVERGLAQAQATSGTGRLMDAVR